MLRSPHHHHTDLPPHTGPNIPKTPRICAATPSHPAEPTAPPISAVARPRPNPHSSTGGTAQYVPLPAVSSLGGFRTPAAVRRETHLAAGVRKPSQLGGRRPKTFTKPDSCGFRPIADSHSDASRTAFR